MLERWHALARGEDAWVNLVASPFVQHALRSERVSELAAQCRGRAGDARALARVEAGLVLRLLALGLSHATDLQLRDLGSRLREVARIDDDGDLVRAIDVLADVEISYEETDQSLERVTRLWPTSDPRPPARDDLARSALASARTWFAYRDPRITPEQRSGWCMSGQPMALAFWDSTASAAYAIGIGASPADVEALVFEAVREMIGER